MPAETAPSKDTGRRDKAPQPDTGVGDCFQWQDPQEQPAKDTPREYQHKFIIKKADIGKARDIGYPIPTAPPPKTKDDGSAGEALRGWPGTNKSNTGQDDANCGAADEDADYEKKMHDLMAHKFIDGAPETPKKPKKPELSEEERKQVEEMAKRPRKVKPAPKVEVKKTKEFDNTLDGRRAWRS